MNIYPFKPTYLYIKQHRITGLKYFGKTTHPNPHKYRGSGRYWTKHIKVHGNDVLTIWTQLFTDRDSLIEYALNFSSKHNIVESTEWANLTVENGIDGNSFPGTKNGRYNLPVTSVTRKKIGKANKGKCLGWHWWNNGTTSIFTGSVPDGEWRRGRLLKHLDKEIKEHRKKTIKPREKFTCCHCNKTFDSSSYTRYHGPNCKNHTTLCV